MKERLVPPRHHLDLLAGLQPLTAATVETGTHRVAWTGKS